MICNTTFLTRLLFCILSVITILPVSHAANLTVEITTTSAEPIRLSVTDDLSIVVNETDVIASNSKDEITLSVNNIKSFRYIMSEDDAGSIHPSETPPSLYWNGTTLRIDGTYSNDTCIILKTDGKPFIKTTVSSVSNIDFSKFPRGIYIIVIRNIPTLKITI